MSDYSLTKEQEEVRDKAYACGKEFRSHADEWDMHFNAPVWDIAKREYEYGLTGLTVPKEYGGHDRTCMEFVLAVEGLQKGAQIFVPCWVLMGTTGAGPTMCMGSDNEVAKKKFLPSLVKGESLCAFDMTEPLHGSGLTDLETSATLEGDHYVVNGHKCYAGLTGQANLMAVFVRLKNIPRSKGIGCIIIEKGSPGQKFGKNRIFLGLREYDHRDLILENCRVPKENLLFPEGQFSKLMGCFNMERLINGTSGMALASSAYELSLKRVQERKQFGRDIVEFQAVQQQLAEMYINVEAARLLIYKAASTAEKGKFPKVLDVTAAKVFANQVAVTTVQSACWLHGAEGLLENEDLPLARMLRNVALVPVAGGTHPVLKTQIAAQLTGRRFSQRAIK